MPFWTTPPSYVSLIAHLCRRTEVVIGQNVYQYPQLQKRAGEKFANVLIAMLVLRKH